MAEGLAFLIYLATPVEGCGGFNTPYKVLSSSRPRTQKLISRSLVLLPSHHVKTGGREVSLGLVSPNTSTSVIGSADADLP